MTPALPQYDAVVLAGGRSSRLGGVAKAGLMLDGETLLQRTCSALSGALSLTIVGPDDAAAWLTGTTAAIFVREEPAFAGPAAALAAAFTGPGTGGMPVRERAPWCVVVACDMPRVAGLLGALLTEAADDGEVSLVAVDGGREQPLAALYRTQDLLDAVGGVLAGGPATNLSVRSLLASVGTRQVPVPPGTTHDVDTWADARALGIVRPLTSPEDPMDDRQKLLHEWTQKLLEAFEIEGTDVDIDAVLDLAGKAAHGVVRPAAPLTTFVAGYAAGLAVGSGQAEEQVALSSAIGLADSLCPSPPAEDPASGSPTADGGDR